MPRLVKAVAEQAGEKSKERAPLIARASVAARAEYIADFARQLAELAAGPEFDAARGHLLSAADAAGRAAE